jgi:arginine exporter protein ArgO
LENSGYRGAAGLGLDPLCRAAHALRAGRDHVILPVLLFAGPGARLLRPLFANPKAWRVLDALIGITLLLLAAKLVLET